MNRERWERVYAVPEAPARLVNLSAFAAEGTTSTTPVAVSEVERECAYGASAMQRDRLYRMALSIGGKAIALAQLVKRLDDAWFDGRYDQALEELAPMALSLLPFAPAPMLSGGELQRTVLEVFEGAARQDPPAKRQVNASAFAAADPEQGRLL